MPIAFWKSTVPTAARTARTAPESVKRAAASAARAVCALEPLEGRQLMAVNPVSLNLTGAATGNGSSGESSISADGRYVAFRSDASDIVAGDNNGLPDIFLRDRTTGQVRLVSAAVGGGFANGASAEPSVSADGRFVGFRSGASNIIGGDTNANDDIFLWDRVTGQTRLVSVNLTGGSGNGQSRETFVSADGRYVCFSSFASNLVPGDLNERTDAFVRDMVENRTILLSANLAGASGNDRSFDPTISANGRFASFRSAASDLHPADTNNLLDVFVRDLTTNTTTLVSFNLANSAGGNGESASASLSGDGRFVVFSSTASDLVANDTNNVSDVFLRDIAANRTTLLSANQLRTAAGNGASFMPTVSNDGNFATFTSEASNLVGNDNNGKADVFLRDLRTGAMTLLSLNAANSAGGNGRSLDPYVSTDGTFVSFTSASSDLGGADANGAADDVFVASAPTPEQDPTPPTAAVAPDQLPPITLNTFYDFDVVAADNVALNIVSLGNLQVRFPDGSVNNASFVSSIGSGPNATLTYRVAAPGGTLTPEDNGAYTVIAPAGAIKDAAGASLPAGELGAFTLNVAPENAPDFVASLAGNRFPASVVGGAKAKSVKVRVTNNGQTVPTQPVVVTLYASADENFDRGDVAFANSRPTVLKLKQGKSKAVSLKFNYPSNIDDGNYFILARADSGNAVQETNDVNNASPSSSRVTIAKPFVDFTATAGAVTKGPFTAGKKGTALVTIRNNGNVPSNSTIDVGLVARPVGAADASTDVSLGSAVARVKLKANSSKAFKLKFTTPSGLPAGNYVLVATVDSTGKAGEKFEDNNVAVGTSTFALA